MMPNAVTDSIVGLIDLHLHCIRYPDTLNVGIS